MAVVLTALQALSVGPLQALSVGPLLALGVALLVENHHQNLQNHLNHQEQRVKL